MADHIVNQIADQFVTLLDRQTDAYDRVFRDRSEPFESKTELPAVDIRIGPDDPQDGNANGPQVSEVTVNVDLYVACQPQNVSADLLDLRKQTYKLIMAGAPKMVGLSAVKRILPGGADEVQTANDGAVPIGYVRTVFFVTYQHSLTDPSL